MLSIGIEEATDHALIMRIVLRSLVLEEIDTAFTQRERIFHAFFAKCEIFGCRKEVRRDPELA